MLSIRSEINIRFQFVSSLLSHVSRISLWSNIFSFKDFVMSVNYIKFKTNIIYSFFQIMMIDQIIKKIIKLHVVFNETTNNEVK